MAGAPLAGCGVLVTRPEGQASPLVGALMAAGARTVELPTLTLVPVADADLERRARETVPAADWLFFVSPNAVRHGLALMRRAGTKWPARARIASVGTGTSAALRAEGLEVDLEPHAGAGSEPLLQRTELAHIDGERAVILRGAGGRELLAAGAAPRSSSSTCTGARRPPRIRRRPGQAGARGGSSTQSLPVSAAWLICWSWPARTSRGCWRPDW